MYIDLYRFTKLKSQVDEMDEMNERKLPVGSHNFNWEDRCTCYETTQNAKHGPA